MNFNRDIYIIFLLFVVEDIFTTWLYISIGSGQEINKLLVELVNGGIYGFVLFFLIKIVVLVIMALHMLLLIKFEFPKIYFFFRTTIMSISFFVVVSNILVYLVGQNIFELMGVW